MKNCINCFLITVSLLLATINLQAQKDPVAIQEKNFENGIKLKIKGFKVSEAALYLDQTNRVPDNNKIQIGQKIFLYIVIDSGWTEINGKIYPGISEILRLSSGAELTRNDDLAKPYEKTGLNAEEAKYITLDATIESVDNKKNHVLVTFRIWDKKGTSEITGSYKLFIK